MEVEAVDEGKIGKIVVAEGTENVKVNAVIAVLLTEGESAPRLIRPLLRRTGRCKRRTRRLLPQHRLRPARRCAQNAAPLRRRLARRCGARAKAALPRANGAARLRLAAGQAAGEGSRHRCLGDQRHRAAWPRREVRRRGGEVRQGAAEGRSGLPPSGGAALAGGMTKAAGDGALSQRAATRSCPMTACARSSRRGSPRPSRPFRIST